MALHVRLNVEKLFPTSKDQSKFMEKICQATGDCIYGTISVLKTNLRKNEFDKIDASAEKKTVSEFLAHFHT